MKYISHKVTRSFLFSSLRRVFDVFTVVVVLSFSVVVGVGKGAIPQGQAPILKTFPPALAEQSKPGTGKFVIFTREQVGKQWDFIAGAWECIPTLPNRPITKRVEFCHSSWNATPLLSFLSRYHSDGLYPRFIRLQVDSELGRYDVNLYDIDFRTWEVDCLSQGRQVSAFGVIGDSIYCKTTGKWIVIDKTSGEISEEVPFTPIEAKGDFWMVTKPGDENCWSYDRKDLKYIGSFRRVKRPRSGYSESIVSNDGKKRALLLASPPYNWNGGKLTGQLILQRDGILEDISHPVEFFARAGSGIAVIPTGTTLKFSDEGNLLFRARQGENVSKDRVWSINSETAKVTSSVTPHVLRLSKERTHLDGVLVPEYLRDSFGDFDHFGRSGLAPAFLLHLGILEDKPNHSDCIAGVSPDGRHIFYKARKGPLADVFIYGDLLTKQVVRWKSPAKLLQCNAMDFVWVETPPSGEQEKSAQPATSGKSK